MSKKSFVFINLFIILSIFNLTISQNIITSWHYDKVQMYDLQKIGNILSSQIMEKVTSLPSFTEDSIQITNLKLLGVQHSLYDSYLNFKTGLLLFTPNKVTLSFNFTHTSESGSGSASFDLKINILKMRLTNFKQNQTQKVDVSMYSTEDDYNVFEIPDKDLLARVRTDLYKGFENNSILNDISSKIDLITYYQDFYKDKKSLDFETSTFLDSKKISVNFNRFVGFCEDVTGKAESALCYYSGEVDGEEKTDKTKVPTSNENFVNPQDTYNTFINIDLLNNILNKLLKDGLSEKAFNKDSVVKTLSYDFTVGSLKKYLSGLDSYQDSETFEAKVKINEFSTNKVKLTANFNIGDKTNVFSLDVELEIKLKVSLFRNVRLNACLESAKTTQVSVKSGGVSITNESGLKSAIEEAFDYDNVPLCLSNKGVTLRDYYSIISKVYCQDEGIYIEGNQLYQ